MGFFDSKPKRRIADSVKNMSRMHGEKIFHITTRMILISGIGT